MAKAKIDADKLRRLWIGGVPSKEIAAMFGVNYPAVNYPAVNSAAKRLGLPPRNQRQAAPVKREEPICPAVVKPIKAAKKEPVIPMPCDLTSALAAAKGYADLSRIADQFDLSLSETQRRWHEVRAS